MNMGRLRSPHRRYFRHARPPEASAPVMAHQIHLFCMPQLADAGCLEADQNGGYLRVGHGSANHAL
jgi:hypothetical protein